MEFAENAYCRLCAERKPNTKLINLLSDHTKHEEVILKLTRLNAGTNLRDINDILPKTVCLVCKNSLDKAFEFVLGVEQAQGVLNNILLAPNIKKESYKDSCSDDENHAYEPSEDISDVVKEEPGTVDLKPVKKLSVVDKKYGKKKHDSNKSFGLDGIPLSQLKLTWKDYIWTCSYCETQFSSVDELKMHTLQYHNCCNAFRCTDCNVRKLRLESFLIHVKRHRKYLKLSCYKCDSRFSTPHEANAHKSVHKNSEYVCMGCNATFNNQEDLNQHSSLYYQANKARAIPIKQDITDNLTCVLCKKTFKQKGSLNTHLLIHTERKRNHTCDKCGKCFLSKQNLAGHMILHDNIRPYQCEICKATFKTETQLRNHVGVHDNKKPFACETCGRCFRLQKQLTSHSIIHTDALPYVCSYCDKRFRFKTILNQHIRQHTGVKPYSCELCQRDFTNWPNYNKHMKRRHGMDMAKKKHTPDGLYPINPATGEVIIYPETDKTLEWKQQMMMQRRPGRPKVNVKTIDDSNSMDREENQTCDATVAARENV